jgi:hypothetical protein
MDAAVTAEKAEDLAKPDSPWLLPGEDGAGRLLQRHTVRESVAAKTHTLTPNGKSAVKQ